jgi:prephenate dehydratase
MRDSGAALPVIAIQGEAGSFSHMAAMQLYGEAVRIEPCATLELLFAAIVRQRCQGGVVPVENSLVGIIQESRQLLQAHQLQVAGETRVRIRHCLIARPATQLAQVRRVASHPVALAQCRSFFAARPELLPVVAPDTAGSVRALMEGTLDADAAIAAALAARLYGAAVLCYGIEDHPHNFTRFVCVTRGQIPS